MNTVHDKDKGCFHIEKDGERCELLYNWLGDNTVDFYRTFVPFALRGRGFAEELVKEAFAWADAQKIEFVSSCWYVEKKRSEAHQA